MTAKIVRTRHVDDAAFVAPFRDDGRPYRFEMIFNGGDARAYADRLADLIDVLAPGYLTTDPQDRYKARLRAAVYTQVRLQAAINADHPHLDRLCSPAEVNLLMGDRATPPEVEVWEAPVPLVLVDTYYEPRGDRLRPVAPEGSTGTLIWLNPLTEWDLLASFHRAGIITLAESLNATAAEMAGPLVPPQT